MDSTDSLIFVYIFTRGISVPVLENENAFPFPETRNGDAFPFPETRNGDAFPFSRTGNVFTISRVKE